jgi:hypothetical protein
LLTRVLPLPFGKGKEGKGFRRASKPLSPALSQKEREIKCLSSSLSQRERETKLLSNGFTDSFEGRVVNWFQLISVGPLCTLLDCGGSTPLLVSLAIS